MHACIENQALFRSDLQVLGLVPHYLLTVSLLLPMVLEHDHNTSCWVLETHVYPVTAERATWVSVRLVPEGSCMTPSLFFIEVITAPLVPLNFDMVLDILILLYIVSCMNCHKPHLCSA